MRPGFDDALPVELLRPAPRAARRRAWWSVAAVSAGAMAAQAWTGVPAGWWIALAIVPCVAGLLLPRRRLGVAAMLGLFLLAAWWFAWRTGTVDARSPQRLVGTSERVLIEAEGLVLSSAEAPPPHRDQLARFRRMEAVKSFDLSLDALVTDGGRVRSRGRLRVSVAIDEAVAVLPGPGSRVRVKGWFAPPRGPMNPGESDGRRWSNMEGRAGSLFASSPALVVPLSERVLDPEAWWMARVTTLRERMLAQIEGDGRYPAGRAMLAALLLGEIDPELRDTRSAFQKSGTAHLLAISGFHLAVLCGLGVLLVRLTGDRGRLEAIVVCGLVVALLVLVPAQVPIVRAGVLAIGLLAGDALGRRYDRLTTLGWVAIALYIWRPMDVFSLGAQLSVGVTALLIWLSAVRHPWVAPAAIRGLRPGRRSRTRSAWRWLRSYAMVCVLCWAMALPVIVAHTGNLSLVGPIATATVTPAVVALLGLGYLSLLAGLVWSDAAVWMFDQLAQMSQWTGDAVQRFADAPINVQVAPISGLLAGVAVLVTAMWLAERRARNPRLLVAIGMLVALPATGPMLQRSLPRDVVLRIDTLAVGDGTCHTVRSGDDAFVWDCGSLRSDLRPILERAMPALGLRHASTAFVTHANLDHFVSMPDAVDLLGIKRVYLSPHVLADPGEPERALLALLADRGVEVASLARGDSITVGRARLEFLWPGEAAEHFAYNDRSLVCRVTVPTEAGERLLLLCGDIQTDAMQQLLDDVSRLRADVLEMPHHGSFRVEAMRFLAAVDPEVVLQSTGSSRVGDPRWADHRASRVWFTTAEDGAAWVEVRKDGTLKAGSMR